MRISDWSSDVCSSDLGLFFDPSQDVRRLARGIVDDARKTIMSRIIAADSELERAVTLDDRLRLCIHLTELHWELVYQKLVPRDEYNQAIDTVTKYAHDALSLNQKDAAMWYLLGRCALLRSDPDAAELLLQHARMCHFPVERLLPWLRSEEHTSELQSLMRSSYAVFRLKKNTSHNIQYYTDTHI